MFHYNYSEGVEERNDTGASEITASPINHKLPEDGADPLPPGDTSADPLPTGVTKSAAVNGQSAKRTRRKGTGKKKITFTREPSSTEEESESEKYVLPFLSPSFLLSPGSCI